LGERGGGQPIGQPQKNRRCLLAEMDVREVLTENVKR
jgi:hypothetical protein